MKKNNSFKTSLRVLFAGTLIMICNSSQASDCFAGGVGSTSCTYSEAYLFGLISITHSVSCGPGYYACCNSETGSCIK